MWNITITIDRFLHIIEELDKFYDSYSLETKLTLKKLYDKLNHSQSAYVNIDIETTAHTINPLVITI